MTTVKEGLHSFCDWIAFHFKVHSSDPEQVVYTSWELWRGQPRAQCAGLSGPLTALPLGQQLAELCRIIGQDDLPTLNFSFWGTLYCLYVALTKNKLNLNSLENILDTNAMLKERSLKSSNSRKRIVLYDGLSQDSAPWNIQLLACKTATIVVALSNCFLSISRVSDIKSSAIVSSHCCLLHHYKDKNLFI